MSMSMLSPSRSGGEVYASKTRCGTVEKRYCEEGPGRDSELNTAGIEYGEEGWKGIRRHRQVRPAGREGRLSVVRMTRGVPRMRKAGGCVVGARLVLADCTGLSPEVRIKYSETLRCRGLIL